MWLNNEFEAVGLIWELSKCAPIDENTRLINVGDSNFVTNLQKTNGSVYITC